MRNFKFIVVRFNNLIFGKLIQKYGLSRLFSKIHLSQRNSFLEIGCGNGYAVRIIKDFFSPKYLIGVDIDKRRIEKAKYHKVKSKVENVKFRVADAQNLPFGNETFDAVFMFATLHHIPDWKKALYETSRVLKKGGYFILKEPLARFYKLPLSKYFDRPSSLFCKDILEEVLRSNGFKINYWSYRGWYKFLFPRSSIETVCQKI